MTGTAKLVERLLDEAKDFRPEEYQPSHETGRLFNEAAQALTQSEARRSEDVAEAVAAETERCVGVVEGLISPGSVNRSACIRTIRAAQQETN